MSNSIGLGLDWSSVSDQIAESLIFKEMQAYDREQRLRYAQVGLMAREVENRSLWKHRLDPDTGLPCGSWTRWLRCACPYSYSSVHAALSDIKKLADVPAEHLAEIPQSNFGTMKQLSTAVRAIPEILQAAKTQKGEDFVETVRKSHPGQHLEHRKALRFRPVESAAKTIEEALEKAMERGAGTRDEALEMIAANALEDWRREQEVESSIEDAFLHAL